MRCTIVGSQTQRKAWHDTVERGSGWAAWGGRARAVSGDVAVGAWAGAAHDEATARPNRLAKACSVGRRLVDPQLAQVTLTAAGLLVLLWANSRRSATRNSATQARMPTPGPGARWRARRGVQHPRQGWT